MTPQRDIVLFDHEDDQHMNPIQRCALSFSGGKDSFLALDRAMRQGLSVDLLVTMYDASSRRVRFHGVPIALIQAQASALGIPLLSYPHSPETFEACNGYLEYPFAK
jgi:diphthamide synthase (EF-2-diphthine--ammonia ligase)